MGFIGRCPCPWPGNWNEMIFKVPSNPVFVLVDEKYCVIQRHEAGEVGEVL